MAVLAINHKRKLQQIPTLLTTGQVAALLGVAARTAAKWIDAGQLRGYRIPGSQDRRVRREDLLGFARQHGMLLRCDGQTLPPRHVLWLTTDRAGLGRLLPQVADADLVFGLAESGFDLGRLVEATLPSVIVLDLGHAGGREACRVIASAIRANPRLRLVRLVAIASEDDGDRDGLLQCFDRVLQRPVSATDLRTALADEQS